MRPWIRYVAPVLFVALMAHVLTVYGVVKNLATWIIFVAATMIFILACRALFVMRDVVKLRNRGTRYGASWDPREDAKGLYQRIVGGEFGNPISWDQVGFFATIAATPNEVQRRITEEYDPIRNALRKKVSIDVEISPSNADRPDGKEGNEGRSQVFLFPLAISHRKVLFDDFKVYGARGEEISPLIDFEYLRDVSIILHMLFSSVRDSQPIEFRQGVTDIEINAIADIIRNVSLETESCPYDLNVEQGMDALIDVCPDGVSKNTLILTAAIIRVLTSRRVKVVRISIPEREAFALTYECALIPTPDPDRWWWVKLKPFRGTLRSTKTVRIWLNNAWLCKSYHATVRSSDSLYLTSQAISPENYVDSSSPVGLDAPYARFRHFFGQSYAKFYGRHLPPPHTQSNDNASARDVTPEIVADFSEVPPGSLFIAMLAAAASAVLIWVAAIAVKHIADGKIDGTDFPVLILAFPGVAATWLGFDMTDSKLFDGALIARISLGFTALISLLAVVLYIGFPSAIDGPAHLNELGVADWRWWGLTFAAIGNSIILCHLWVLNQLRYMLYKGKF